MKRLIRCYLAILPLFLFTFSCEDKSASTSSESPNQKPNIVIIYADDLGYGDVSSYGGKELITPNIDRLAGEGIRFTNGYCTSATCTPSRYGLLTGRYPWKNKRARILSGTAPLVIDTALNTLPKMLQGAGYYTGIVGKWHLGLGNGNVDWNREVKPGPRAVGFDYAYIMAATNDRVPTVYLENGHVLNLDPNDPIEVSYQQNFPGQPTGKENPELLKMLHHHGHNQTIVNGVGRIGYMKGGDTARWIDENMADTFLVRAQAFVHKHQDAPFFLYYALHQPHVPRIPHPRFAGKSGMGPRGDVILEADWCVGEFMKTLDDLGIAENTLVVFSSDNGPVLNDGYYDEAVEKLGDHEPAGPLRGGKYSLFDAGTRVPFILRWKGQVSPQVSDALVCQMDFLASFASLLGIETEPNDSENILGALLGRNDTGREELVLEATGRTAYRRGRHILIPPYDGPAVNKNVNIELGNSSDYQLYDLEADVGQQKNLAEERSDLLEEMKRQYSQVLGGN